MTTPDTMAAVEARQFSIAGLTLARRSVPRPRRGEILVRVRAASLNYRDLAILVQRYLPQLALPYVPASDACGEVVALGEDVGRFRVGDRVVPLYTQGWHGGRPTPEMRSRRTLGGPLDGVLQEYVVVPAEDAVSAPPHLTDAEASTLPIAALTAWTTLQEGGVKPGDTVLVQGTGGVALFALQFARLAGARVIVLSSSPEKLARARALGADEGIDYRANPEWHEAVRETTGGRGVDIIVETAGSTLDKSLACLTFGGFIGIVGFVAGYKAEIPLRAVIGPMVRLQGIAVGSRAAFEAMNQAISAHRLEPVVDSVFPLGQAAEAFTHMEQGRHFGKVVIQP